MKESERAIEQTAGKVSKQLSDSQMNKLLFDKSAIKKATSELSKAYWIAADTIKKNKKIEAPIPITFWSVLKWLANDTYKDFKKAFSNIDKIKTPFNNLKASLRGVTDWMRKDFDKVWNFWKWLVIPLTIVWWVAGALTKQSVEESNTVEGAKLFASSKLWYSNKDFASLEKEIPKLSKELWVWQEEVWKTLTEAWSANIKAWWKDMLWIVKTTMQYNIAGWRQEDVSTSLTNLNQYIVWWGDKQTLENFKKASDTLIKAANISAGSDPIVKQNLANLQAMGKAAGFKRQEVSWLYTTLVGTTGNPDEAETQTRRILENVQRLSSDELKTYKKMWFKEDPASYISKYGAPTFFKELFEKASKLMPETTKTNVDKKRKELAELDKKAPTHKYNTSTETIDPLTGKYVQVETEESIKAFEEYSNKRKKILEGIATEQNKAFESMKYSEDPTRKALWDMFQDINAYMPVIYLANGWLEKFNENLKDMSNTAWVWDKAIKTMTSWTNFKFAQATADLQNFRIALWDWVKWDVLVAFQDLNKFLNDNRETLQKLISGWIKYALESFKDLSEWVINNKDEIWKFWETAKNVFWEFMTISKNVWWEVWPILWWIWDWYKKLDKSTQTFIATTILMSWTIKWAIWALSSLKDAFLLAKAAGWLLSIKIWTLGWILATTFLVWGVAWGAITFMQNWKDSIDLVKESLDKLDSTYQEMSFNDKTSTAWIDNRLKAIQEQKDLIKWGKSGTLIWEAWQILKWNTKEEEAALARLDEQEAILKKQKSQIRT